MNESLQQKLNNGLRQRLAGNGSPEYSLTWKEWAISGQEPICALRAVAHRTSDKGCGGLPTPGEDNANNAYGHKGTDFSDLPTTAQMAGWPTPIVNDTLGSTHCYGKKTTDGSPRPIFLKLPGAALLAGRPTPKASEAEKDSRTTAGAEAEVARNKGPSLSAVSVMAGWPTPIVNEDAAGLPGSRMQAMLGSQVKLADPNGRDSGQTPSGTHAATAKPAALNPAFSRWLQGYPVGWCQAAIKAFRKMKRTPRQKPGSQG